MKGFNIQWTSRKLVYMIKNKENNLTETNMLSEKPRSGLSETRKMTKSTMEKKRRARINNSLTELKSILSGMIANKGERFDKMEKADILEMTVKCVRQLQKQTNSGEAFRMPSIPGDEDYRSGMHTCMSEVIKFISSTSFSDTDPEVKTKLLDHLANKLHSGTSKKAYIEPDSPCSYQTYGHENNVGDTNIDSTSLPISGTTNDPNNNLQTINDKNTTSLHSQTPPSQKSPIQSPVFAPCKSFQPLLDSVNQQQSVPTVPLTILVPANICSTAVGTTCVIPFNLPTASPQLGQTGVLATVTQPSQPNLTLNSGTGISLISASNAQPNALISSRSSDIISLSPEGRIYTFTPTVLPETNRQTDSSFNINDQMKPSSVSFSQIYHTLKENDASASLRLNTLPDHLPTVLASPPKVATVNASLPTSGFPEASSRGTVVNENCPQAFPLKCSQMEEYDATVKVQARRDRLSQEKRPLNQEQPQGVGKLSFTEQRQNIEASINSSLPGSFSFVQHSKPSNICDNGATGMWRPW